MKNKQKTIITTLITLITLITNTKTITSSTTSCFEGDERTTITLDCGLNDIEGFNFVSYGTPQGSCGSYSEDGSCHSDNSLTKVSNQCLGLSTCSFYIDNDFFDDDPCSGTVKWLYIEAICGTPTPTLSPTNVPTLSPTLSPTPTPILLVDTTHTSPCTGVDDNVCESLDNAMEVAASTGIAWISLVSPSIALTSSVEWNGEIGLDLRLDGQDEEETYTIDCSSVDPSEANACMIFGNFTTLEMSEITITSSQVSAITFNNANEVTFDTIHFDGNHGVNGGAIYGKGISHMSFIDCQFDSNYASNNGGAIYIDELVTSEFDNTYFSGNSMNNKGVNIYWATEEPVFDIATSSALDTDSVDSGYYLDLGTWIDDCGDCKYNSGNMINISNSFPQITMKDFYDTIVSTDDTSIVSVTGDPITSTYDFTLTSGTVSIANVFVYDEAGTYDINLDITSTSVLPFNDYTVAPGISFDVTIKQCKQTYYRDSTSLLCEKCDTAGEYSEGFESTECSTCEAGYYCPGNGTRIKCPAGRYGDDTGLVDPSCNGLCAPGFYCGIGSTSQFENECGNADFYCPEGSTEPLSITSGFCGVGDPNTQQYDIEACDLELSYITPTSGTTEGGYLITLVGSGLNSTTQVIRIGDNVCTYDENSEQNDTVLYCNILPGSGEELAVTITSDLTGSSAGGPTFSYFSPNITKVEGCNDKNKKTTNCPTKGEVTLTITGSDFTNDEDGISAFVGGNECTDLTLTIVHKEIQCTLPEGAGEDLSVQVVTEAGQSDSKNLISYSGPTIHSIIGCNDTDSDLSVNATNACSRTQEELVLVSGKNFGPNGARVMIGGNLASSIDDNNGETNYHEKLYIHLPQGSGLSLGVNLIQSGGQISDGVKLVSYIKCAPGEYNVYNDDTDFWLCEDCPIGKISTDFEQYSCSECEAGKYWNDTTSCNSCDDIYLGSESPVGSINSSACECPNGFVLNGNSCDCPPGFEYDSSVGECSECGIGEYKVGINRDSCSSCSDLNADSTTSDVGSTSPNNCSCPSGFILNGDSCDCPTGYEYDATHNECDLCPIGTYKTEISRGSCIECNANITDSTTENLGSNSSDLCICPDGFILEDNECKCYEGTYYVLDESKCQDCGIGEWLDTKSRLTSCYQCVDTTEDFYRLNSETLDVGSTSFDDCVCKTNYYLDLNNECQKCPEGTTCNAPGYTTYTIPIDEGYWRVNEISVDILECPEESACKGTETFATSNNFTAGCAEGYEGPYCFNCAEGFAKQIDGTCDECDTEKIGLSIFILVFFGFFCILVVGLLLWKMSQKRDRSAHQRWIEQSVTVWSRDDGVITNKKAISRPGDAIQTKKTLKEKKAARTTELLRAMGGGPYHQYRTKIKVLFSFFQMLTTIPTTFQVVFPAVFENFLDALSIVNLDLVNIFSLDCFVSTNFYLEVIGLTLTPICLIAIIWGWYVIQIVTKEYRAGSNSQFVAFSSTMSAFLTLTYLVFPTVSTKLFQLYICDDFDDGSSYMTYDLTVDCNTSKHESYEIYGGFMIALYPVGIPFMYWILLWKNREALNPFMPGISDRQTMIERDRNESVHFISFLYEPYKPQFYWYEVLECGRRLFFTSVAAFVLEGTSSQLAIGVLCALFFLAIFYYAKPYADDSDNLLSLLSHWCLLLTLFGGLLIKVGTTQDDNYDLYAMGIMLVIVNFLLLFWGFAGILSTTLLLYLEMKKKYPKLSTIDHINMMIRGEEAVCALKGIERSRDFDAVEKKKGGFKWNDGKNSKRKAKGLSRKSLVEERDEDRLSMAIIGQNSSEGRNTNSLRVPQRVSVFRKEAETKNPETTTPSAPSDGIGDFEMTFFGGNDKFSSENPLFTRNSSQSSK